MPTYGTQAITLADIRKRMTPDGQVDYIIENLENENPIMQDMVFLEGNLIDGNKTTIRTSIPIPDIRKLNSGVAPSKSTTSQITDTCCILEAYSRIDEDEIAGQNNMEAYRKTEDAAHLQGFADKMADLVFYGDTDTTPEEFNGLSVRYPTIGGSKGKSGYQVVSGGTAGTNTNTSIYIVGWGQRATTGIYPKNSVAGLKMNDLGKETITDADGKIYRAYTTQFKWKNGLSVRDIRSNAIIRNIDVSKLNTLTDSNKKTLMQTIVAAKNRIHKLQSSDKKVAMYVSDTMYTFIENYLNDKSNVYVTRRELMDKMPELFFSGIPVKKCDAILETEGAYTA